MGGRGCEFESQMNVGIRGGRRQQQFVSADNRVWDSARCRDSRPSCVWRGFSAKEISSRMRTTVRLGRSTAAAVPAGKDAFASGFANRGRGVLAQYPVHQKDELNHADETECDLCSEPKVRSPLFGTRVVWVGYVKLHRE